MPRPTPDQRRADLTPKLAHAFADLGYARATTAKLAAACDLQETQLYRLWPSKKAMFLAVIRHLYELETAFWNEHLTGAAAAADPDAALAAILDAEAKHRGQTGLHRITFAGLSEASDPEIRAALAGMYTDFHRFIRGLLKDRAAAGANLPLDPGLAAWSLIGLGTLANIARELDLFGLPTQKKLMRDVGGTVAGLD